MILDLTLVIGLAATCLASTLRYAFVPWWTDRLGIALFMMLAASSIITGLSALQVVGIFDHTAARIAYALMILAVGAVGVTIHLEQREGRRRRRQQAKENHPSASKGRTEQ